MAETLVDQARTAHREAAKRDKEAARARVRRDRIIKRLRKSDPQQWTYAALGEAIGCSRELVSQIVKRP